VDEGISMTVAIDGAVAAQFTSALRGFVKSPMQLVA
jgi:hypothetical protein